MGSHVSASEITNQDESHLPVRQPVSDSSGGGLSQTPNSQSPWSLAGARGQVWRLVGRASCYHPPQSKFKISPVFPCWKERANRQELWRCDSGAEGWLDRSWAERVGFLPGQTTWKQKEEPTDCFCSQHEMGAGENSSLHVAFGFHQLSGGVLSSHVRDKTPGINNSG